jgi:2-desacetyl-2-hydroxyethyl bacteriochlorophyllide A dehydrogenase
MLIGHFPRVYSARGGRTELHAKGRTPNAGSARSKELMIPPRARGAIASGLGWALTARGIDPAEHELVRAETIDWAWARARALRHHGHVIAGLGVMIPRPGRAELRPVELASPGPDQVTVEILASSVSPGTERAQWLRLPNAQPRLPFAPGYSGAGIVLASGSGVSDRPPGTVVAVARARHASVATVPASWTTPVPDGVEIHDAALVYLAIIAGYGVDRAGPINGESVCILGAGAIGLLALRVAVLRGAGGATVVAATRRAEPDALAAGAVRFATLDDQLEEIRAQVVIDATGNPESVAAATAAARPGGRIVLLGSPRGVTRGTPIAEIQRKGLTIVGAHISSLAVAARRDSGDPFARLAEEFLAAIAAHGIDVASLRGEACDPREIGLLYRRLARQEVRAAYLDWSVVPRGDRVRRRAALSLPRLSPRPHGLPASAVRTRAVSRRLRFALIGCGDIGVSNARAIAASANGELTISHDQVRGLADSVAAAHGCAVADSLSDALNREIADAVLIAVPHHLHAPLAAQAAAAGLHVLVEKPLAIDVAGARQAINVAASSGVQLSVCFIYRYDPAVRLAARLLEAGALGAIRGANVLFHADKPASYWVGGFSGRATSTWRSYRSTAGGGVLIMNLSHYVDMIRHLAKVELRSVAGAARTESGAEVEESVALAVTLDGGAVASLSASAATRGAPANRFELWGEHGTVRLEPDPAIYTERAIPGLVPGRWTPLAPGAPDHSRRTLIERFADAILAGSTPDVTPGDGLAVQEFIAAAYRAIETGTPTTLECGLAA